MTTIHATAIIDPKAELDPSVSVGPYAVIGPHVRIGAGTTVGEIKDLVLVNNQLAGYILSVGGFLGMGEHYVAVTPGTVGLAYNEADKKWKGTINATKDELKAAPQFTYDGKFKR